jgi:hypothetical protein
VSLAIRRCLIVAALVVVSVLPAAAALAASFNTMLSYTVDLTGPNRDFFQASSTTIRGTYARSAPAVATTHRVELWRNRFGPDDFVGSSNVPREGFASPTWTNTGPGTYRFRYVKAADGVRITSNDLVIRDQNG